MSDEKHISPIFITGSVRSGTSIVAEGLIKGAGIPGYTEGCFIDIFGIFIRAITTRYKNRESQMLASDIMLKYVPFDEFKKSYSEWFFDLYKKYSIFEGVFVDKTPTIEVVSSCNDILENIPNSKFIIMKRRPIENIESRLRKFSNFTFEHHCVVWVEIMNEISNLEKTLPKNKFIIIDQYDVSKKPEEIASQIGIFLNLDFNQIEKMKNIFIKSRPENTGGNEDNVKSLEETGWTESQKKFFLDTCGPVCERFGWSVDEKYYIG